MRTKNLLLSAAALVAGALSAQAQSNVYSVNIVGYVNTVLKGNAYTLVANPFDDGNGNQLTNLVASLPKQSAVLVWDNGSAGYVGANKTVAGWNTNFSIAPGRGFFVKNGGAGAPDVTNTFVGSESLSNNVVLPTGYSLVGSPLAFAGDLTTSTNINLGNTLPKQSALLRWDVPTQSYVGANKTIAGWNNGLTIAVGEGFFVKPGSATNWIQVLPQ